MSESEIKKSSSLAIIPMVVGFIIILFIVVGVGMIFHGVKNYVNEQEIAPETTDVQESGAPDKPAQQAKPEKKNPEKPADDGAATDGNAAIAFHNNLLGFMGASSTPFKKIDQAAKDSQEFINRGSSRPGWGRIFHSADNFNKIPNYPFVAPDSFNAADREFFNTRIEIVKKSCAELIKLDKELADYYTAEDYKDDWHKKFLVTKHQIYNLMDKIIAANDEMHERSNAITEEIDRRNLAKTPYGVYVLNMRYTLDKAKLQTKALLAPELRDTRYGVGVSEEERMEMIARATSAADQVEALEKEMDEMVAKYQAANREKIKGTNLEREYDGFFKNYESAKPDLTRIIRDLREKGYYNDQHIIKSYQESLVRSHNRFVDILNGK